MATDRDPLDAIADVACPHVHHHAMCAPCAADAIRPEVERLTEERDLAIAGDRQSYPTAWAYDQVCKALETQRERTQQAEADVERLTKELALHEAAAPATNELAKRQRERAELAEDAIERVRVLCEQAKTNAWEWRGEHGQFTGDALDPDEALAALDHPTDTTGETEVASDG